MLKPQQFLIKLQENLTILQEREAKYGGRAPLDLHNQIEDHQQAMALTRQVIAGDLDETAWQEALQPLLLPFYQGLSHSVLEALLETASSAPETAPSPPASRLQEAMLAHLQQTSRGQVLAEGFKSAPDIYEKPVHQELTLGLQSDAEFALRLHRLLAEVEAGTRTGGDQAILSGSGAIGQGGGTAVSAIGRGNIAIGSAGGDVTIGHDNLTIRDSQITAHDRAVIGSRAGGDISTGDTVTGVSGESLAALFAELYRQIEMNPALSPEDREDVTAEVTELAATVQSAVESDNQPDESFLRRRLRNIEAMAPDIIDTIAVTAANPVAGVKGVWDKIVAKAREIKAARQK